MTDTSCRSLQDGREVNMKIRKTMLFSRIFGAFCQKLSIDLNTVVFLFDGHRIHPEKTPADVRLLRGSLFVS